MHRAAVGHRLGGVLDERSQAARDDVTIDARRQWIRAERQLDARERSCRWSERWYELRHDIAEIAQLESNLLAPAQRTQASGEVGRALDCLKRDVEILAVQVSELFAHQFETRARDGAE
ncbi:MAG TPA: hypothetical protein VLD39_11245, partial [Gammaproteobacteria bacterium]|nr:hypothetical protein [Gammaproteobacteria bacterium]